MDKCEVCGADEDLIACADIDQPMLRFCPAHYVWHVNVAHGGKPLPGCETVEYALHLFSSTD